MVVIYFRLEVFLASIDNNFFTRLGDSPRNMEMSKSALLFCPLKKTLLIILNIKLIRAHAIDFHVSVRARASRSTYVRKAI